MEGASRRNVWKKVGPKVNGTSPKPRKPPNHHHTEMPPVRSEPRSTPNRRDDTSKVISACTNCKAKKVKCSGEYPCMYCTRRELHCTFPASQDIRMHSQARIRELETRLALYEPQATTGSSSTSLPRPNEDSTAQRISTERDIGSSQDFGYRVQRIFEQRSNQPPEPRTRSLKSIRASLFPGNPPRLQPRVSRPGWSLADLHLPSEEDAFQLLDTVLFYFEEPQHLFDARYISDRLTAFYEDREEQLRKPDIRVVQILVILALGKLIRGEQDDQGLLPGIRLFNLALDFLPSPDELRSQGVAGIETIAIIAIYLQNGDRTDDAATYVGLAVRLATLLKLHRKAITKNLRRSEATHVGRLWWTIHSHDKRLMIATGCPRSLDDQFVDACPLTESPGFPNPAALQINIEIAHVQNQIYSVIYSNESCPKDVFLKSVEGIISSLHEIFSKIEHKYSLEPTRSSKKQLRTSISLRTILYQSIILTLRPIVLHLTKSILDREITFPESHHSFQSLTGTCIEAARWCLELMIVARKENMIAIFGFFDLDTIFSAGFILLMGEMIDAASAGHGNSSVCLRPSPGLSEAMDLLRYLASFQNRAADSRLQQMLRLRTRIPSLVEVVSLHEEMKSFDRLPQADASEVEGMPAGIDIRESSTLDFRMPGISMEGLAQRSLPIHFPTDLQDMHSVYHDEDFVLTGADIADFEELQRQLFGHELQS